MLAGVILGLLLAASTSVPFVGCPTEGMTGPEPAPQGEPRKVDLPEALAARLAWYQMLDKGGPGVLAPRGWHCAGADGSTATILTVVPDAAALGRRAAGPAVVRSITWGGTSGRFPVAQMAARYFPEQKSFIRGVIAEGLEPASSFRSGPFPGDRVLRMEPREADVETQPGRKGAGTAVMLDPGKGAIRTRLRLEAPRGDLELKAVSVRLPANMGDLTQAILDSLQREGR
jgi:hypothetical protein